MERKGQKIPGPTCSILITAVILYLALRTKYGQRSMLDLLLVLFRGCLQQSSGEGDGTPLQYSCLKNPMDGGAWWAASPWGREELDTTERLPFHFSLSFIGEGNGNPLVFLPAESQGQGSLVGCRLWCHTESDTTEAT